MTPSRDSLPPGVLLVLGNGITGGMETAVLRLVRSLPAGAWRIAALLPFDGALADGLRQAGAGIAIVPMPADPAWLAVQTGVALVREHALDVVHAHLPNAHALAALVGRAARVPVLATVHGMHATVRDVEAQRVGRTTVCVVSEAACRHAAGIGIPTARLRLVRNAVDGQAFAPGEGARAGSARTAPLVGYAGRLSPEKNPRLFVRIAARVHQAHPAARFVLAGDGPLRAELEREAALLGAGDAVRFLGEHPDMPSLYRTLDVLVSTSWHEGTPLAALEAMASGVPLVASDVGGLPELVRPGETGALYPPGDEAAAAAHVLALLADDALRRRLGAAARERALARFGWEAHVGAVTALWRELASAPRVDDRPRRPA